MNDADGRAARAEALVIAIVGSGRNVVVWPSCITIEVMTASYENDPITLDKLEQLSAALGTSKVYVYACEVSIADWTLPDVVSP